MTLQTNENWRSRANRASAESLPPHRRKKDERAETDPRRHCTSLEKAPILQPRYRSQMTLDRRLCDPCFRSGVPLFTRRYTVYLFASTTLSINFSQKNPTSFTRLKQNFSH
jgi:hypothetical protein